MQQFVKYSHTIERLHQGSLSEYIGLCASLLKQHGYFRALVQSRILLINRFSRWLERNGIGTYTIEALERDEHGRAKYMGYVLQFGGWPIYHSGDTVRYEGMSENLQPFKIDIALFPINSGRRSGASPGIYSGESQPS